MKFDKTHITINDGWISVGNRRVGLWWKYYDKKVCISYGFGESFIAQDEFEVKEGILKILNKQKWN